ncbi:MAG: 2-dehydropantoate 2-reductase [Acidaminococcaceae bacterium]|nr:2-dehydropantoate 2-reductase [Acidaminococcaceae bacterium]
MKIMVVGLGGVGGYIASILCSQHEKEVTLIARKKRKDAMLNNGLVLHSDFFGEHVYHPRVTDNPAAEGIQDVIFVCVKNYSLETALTSIVPCVGPKTIVVYIMNGVDHDKIAYKVFPQGRVVDVAIYIVSAFKEDYSIRQYGQFARVFVGSEDKEAAKLVYDLLHVEGLSCHLSEDIKVDIWKKFILNCGYNVITAYYVSTIGEAFAQPQGKAEFKGLVEEACAVAKALKVKLPDGFADFVYNKVINQEDKNVSSSLARDIKAGKQSELETFCGCLVRFGHELSVPVPVTERMYKEIKGKIS